ncbi:LuxR C-terminal-related transcriptional regulator [Blastococcus deserti]|uniref:LuxR C-terminal-related transcriptional regulator n=1 Tax=Blastococcus deserti TaxID=2259033 RepID=A0ABW4X7P2_9ACTN
MTDPASDALERSREALRRGDAGTARRLIRDADVEAFPGAVREVLAQAAYLDLDFRGAAEHWREAYAAYRASGDCVDAVRVARTVAPIHLMVLGEQAVGRGWLARAQTLLAGVPGSREAGWVALDLGMFENDRARKEGLYREALEAARRYGDRDLEFVTLAYLGASLVHGDRTAEGMALLDEALAAVAGDEVGDFCVLEEIFCQLFSACEYAHDVQRADEWIRVGEAIAQRRRLPTVSAFCRTHYGGVLTKAGRWSEAETALTEAVRLWGVGKRSGLRLGALVRLAALRVRQGRFEEAAQLLTDVADDVTPESAPPLAAVHLAAGRTELAADVLTRALTQVAPHSTEAAPLWALLVEVHLAAERLDAAQGAAEEVARCARRHPVPYLTATAALARGLVCLHEGTDPCDCLREALTGFTRAQLPMEVARCRLALARALREHRAEVARTEAKAALETFRELRADRDADAAAALLRELGVRGPAPSRATGPLTRREAEVLELLGHGLSNPEIATRLFISRKTAEHHVANVLAKLGLRSRAEAAGYAVRAGVSTTL